MFGEYGYMLCGGSHHNLQFFILGQNNFLNYGWFT